jgi:surface protein
MCQAQAICNNTGSVFNNKNELQVAVNRYLSDKDSAVSLYGTMNCWDVSRVTDMSYLFNWKYSMNEDIGCWDVSNVTSMEYMFYRAGMFNQNIGNWNVSKVKNMNYMFSSISFYTNIGAWNVSKEENVNYMYYSSSFNQNIGAWDVSSVISMRGMFYYASSFNQNISRWNISQVQDLSSMFYAAEMFNQSLCNWFQYFTLNMPYTYSMFSCSGCPFSFEPNLAAKSHFFCQKCEKQDGRTGMFLFSFTLSFPFYLFILVSLHVCFYCITIF